MATTPETQTLIARAHRQWRDDHPDNECTGWDEIDPAERARYLTIIRDA